MRVFQQSLEELSNINGKRRISYIVDYMNGRKETESIIVSFFEYYEETLLIRESNKYFHFEMLMKLVELNWEKISLGRNCKYGSDDMYFF